MSATKYYVEIKKRNYPTAVPYRRCTGCIGFYEWPEAFDIADEQKHPSDVEYVNIVNKDTGKIFARFYHD